MERFTPSKYNPEIRDKKLAIIKAFGQNSFLRGEMEMAACAVTGQTKLLHELNAAEVDALLVHVNAIQNLSKGGASA
ncbi:hypothetical protein CIG75_12895 [Tumebacillus algifaecis]|uniref:Uncharacterized protein n=1 Tax=Tumebacillus algifaecis TaxID=1214604 RepID=A0A223D334_9BACL|nr:hypothetical protein [Tumebacillus algifaecis]ASS75796.1 hypothetical protein CIG75_12895 [Tumebacillus algifaecis]